MEIPINKSGLGDPALCRAIVIHRIVNASYADLDNFASKRVYLYNKSIFPDSEDWSARTVTEVLPGSAWELDLHLMRLNFDPDHDYVVLSGDVLRIATVCALIGRRWGRFCLLRHDKQMNGYWPFMVNIEEYTPWQK